MWSLAARITQNLLNSLSFKLSFSAGLIIFLAVGAAAWVEIDDQRARMEELLETEAQGFIETVRRATYWSMLRNERESQHRIIRDIGQQDGIERVRVFNKEGVVMFSSDEGEIGHAVDMHAEACYGCHATDTALVRLPQAERTRLFSDGQGRRLLSTILPIYNEPACSGGPCHAHPPGKQVLGVLDVTMDLSRIDAALDESLGRTITFAVLLFLVVSTFIGVSIILTVNRSVRRFTAEAEKVAAGEHEAVRLVEAPDELGKMAMVFNNMASQVALRHQVQDQRYRQLVTNSTDAVMVTDLHGRLLMANPEAGRMLGQAPEDLTGRDVLEFIDPDDRAQVRGAARQAVRLARPSDMVRFRVHTSAGAKVLEGRFRHLPEENGLGGVLANLRDITERQAMEAELDRRRAFEKGMIEQALNAIIATDAQGVVQVFNHSAEELLGVRALDVQGRRSFRDFFPRAQTRHLEKAFFNKPRPGDTLVRPAVVKAADGRRLPVMISAFPLFIEGVFSGAVLFLQNLRESKRLKAQLLKKTRLAAVGQTSAGLAHCIKNVLHGLGTASYLVDQGLAEKDLQLTEKGWGMVKRNLAQVEDLTQDLLAYAKDRRPQYQVFNLNMLLRECAGLVAGRAEALQARVEVKPDTSCERVELDPQGIKRVVVNLVSNALDAMEGFEPAQGQRRVEIACGRDGAGQVIIAVSDNGPGLTPEARQHLFHGLFSTKGSKGTGLGLLVSQKIVEEHGGALEFFSQPGQGARFTFAVPDLGHAASGDQSPA